MAEIVNIAIEKAIRNKKIDLLEFTKANLQQEYYAYYKYHLCECVSHKRMNASIDLKGIADDIFLKRIVSFLWDCMDTEKRTPRSYHDYIIVPLRHILNKIETAGGMTLSEFLAQINLKNHEGYTRNEYLWCNKFRAYCILQDYKNDPFASDIWYLDKMAIAPERLNPARHRSRLKFYSKNANNQKMIKDYAKYLLLNTDYAIESIYQKISVIQDVLNQSSKDYTQWDDSDGENIICGYKKNNSDRTIAIKIIDLKGFTEYLISTDVLTNSPIKKLYGLANCKSTYRETSADKYILIQIFNALGDISDPSLVIWFLLIYCTGMRVSESCQMKKDCLERSKDSFFVKYYQNKMKKEVMNIIPKALYELMEDYRKTVSEETEYLFPGRNKIRPRQVSSFIKDFREELAKHNIVDANGLPYNFSPHSYRHLMAARMREADIPFQYIVEQLHHESPEMTLVYTEFLDRQKILKEKKFVNAHGEISPVISDLQQVTDEDYSEYLRKFINAQMLPNGICARPVKLGPCKHCNACIFCDDFRTSRDFLSVHEDHLRKTNEYILQAEKNGWMVQASCAKKVKEVLEKLIYKLKKE